MFHIILAGIGARYFRLPYTTILVLAGLGLEALGFLPAIELTPELVLLLFLPPLAFEAGFHLDVDRLRQDLTPVAVLALFGVILSMAVAGLVLVFTLGIPWQVALLFGTLIAATDPVSVVAVFRELGGLTARAILLSTYTSEFDPIKGNELNAYILARAREIGDRAVEARILWIMLLLAKYSEGNIEHAIAHGERSLALARELGLRELVAYTLNDLAYPYGMNAQFGASRAAGLFNSRADAPKPVGVRLRGGHHNGGVPAAHCVALGARSSPRLI